MWTKTYSKTYFGVRKEDIWTLWSDVNSWTKWQGDLDFCTMEGPFAAGNFFLLKPKGVKPVRSVLTDVKEGYRFTDCTSFFGAKMYDSHSMEETSEGLRMTSTLNVTGPLQWLWVQLVAKNVAAAKPREMDALVELARSLHG